jgi:hypothetical protein
MGMSSEMSDETHLVSPEGGTFCGMEAHEVYTRKDRELVGMTRLAEVDCKACLDRGAAYYWNAGRGLVHQSEKVVRARAALLDLEHPSTIEGHYLCAGCNQLVVNGQFCPRCDGDAEM